MMQLTYTNTFSCVAREWCGARPRPQVTCAVNHKRTRSSTRTLISAAHKAESGNTADRSRSRSRRSVSVGRPATTPSAQFTSNTGLLHHFVRFQHDFKLGSLYLSHWFGNPLKAAAPGNKVPINITIVRHSSEWDPDAYVSSQLSQDNPTGQHAARMPAVAAGSTAQLSTAAASNSVKPSWNSSPAGTDTIISGPLPAFAKKYRAHGETRVIRLKGRDIAGYASGEDDAVLLEQVGPATFILHTKPHSPDTPRQSARPVSHVGQGTGLQVSPGSIPAVDCAQKDVHVGLLKDKKRAQLGVPKELVYSQVPGVNCPAALDVIVSDPQGGQPDHCFPAKMYLDKADMKYRTRVSSSHPLAAYAGRRINRMAFTPGGQLTLDLAP